MNNSISNILEKISSDLLEVARLVLDTSTISANRKTNKNTLSDSSLKKDLKTIVKDNFGEDVVISALFNNYVVFLEWDRPPKYGKRPPVDALEEWARKNGIPTDAATLWAISTAIWRDGHVGRPIFATLDVETDNMFNTEWAGDIFNSITEQLDKFFN